MLVLTRTEGDKTVLTLTESLPVGTRIEVHQLRVGSGKCRVGIRAPSAVHVLRSELEPTPEKAA